jgi:sulfate transport system ATP-binding protein
VGITVRDISKRFGDFAALDSVSVEAPTGSLTALLGPSGSGKSTLLRAIAGLDKQDSGEIFIFEEEKTRMPPQKRGVGFVFQHYAAFKHMTVFDNVAFGMKIRKRNKAEIHKRVHELLELVQLEAFANRYPSQLSGGQRQRMALARALAIEPQVLLLDEPFGALDARVRQELRAWLRRLHEEIEITTVLVTHDQEEAMELADRVVLMNHGRIEQVGKPRDLYENPANEFVMSFIGPVNRLGDAFVRPHDIRIQLNPNGSTSEATVEHLSYLGFEVRVEMALEDGRNLWAQVTHEESKRLGLEQGKTVYLCIDHSKVFSEPAKSQASECWPPEAEAAAN